MPRGRGSGRGAGRGREHSPGLRWRRTARGTAQGQRPLLLSVSVCRLAPGQPALGSRHPEERGSRGPAPGGTVSGLAAPGPGGFRPL